MAELKPCPFCGCKTIRINAYGFGQYSAQCVGCFVETARSFGSNACYYNGKVMQKGKEEAIEAWNRRAEDGKAD